MPIKKAVVILSGGLDSTVSLALARRNGVKPILALYFDYGQRARRKERSASRAIARHYRLNWKQIDLPWLNQVTRTGLVRGVLPKVEEKDLDNRAKSRRSAAAVWVPNRNGVFLNIAAALAESMGAASVITGFDREEAATFPDNSNEYIHAVNQAFRYSTANHVRVRSFVRNMSKATIVAMGIRHRAPLQLAWSCYRGGRRPCGACESCVRSLRAFRTNMSMHLWGGTR